MSYRLQYNYPVGRNYGNTIPVAPECLNPQAVWNTTTHIYHRSQVEPNLSVNPLDDNEIVVVWQQGRIDNGGALTIGIAYTHNGGKKWEYTCLPIQICSACRDTHKCEHIKSELQTQRASDPWLTWSADGSKCFLNIIMFNATAVPDSTVQQAVMTTISRNGGETWGPFILQSVSDVYLSGGTGFLDDKNSITADPYRTKYIYTVWDRLPSRDSYHSDTMLSLSRDKGRNWEPTRLIYDPYPDLFAQRLSNDIYDDCSTINNIVVAIPERALCFMTRTYAKPGATDEQYKTDTFPYQYTKQDIVFIQSDNKGRTWSKRARLVVDLGVNNVVFTGGYIHDAERNIITSRGYKIRSGDVTFSVAANKRTGDIYLVYQTGIFRSDKLCQIALVKSSDEGITWSEPIRVSRTPTESLNPQAFTPTVSVSDNGIIAVMYADFRNDDLRTSGIQDKGEYPMDHVTKTDVWVALYEDTTASQEVNQIIFSQEIRLTEKSFGIEFGPFTTMGIMSFGDYMAIREVDGAFYLAYTAIPQKNLPFPPPEGMELYYEDSTNNAALYLDRYIRSIVYVAKIS